MLNPMNELKPGNYFERRNQPKPKKTDEIQSGDLVLVRKVDYETQKVEYMFRESNSWWTTSIDDFLTRFKYEPNGRMIRDAELQALIAEASGLAAEINQESEQLQGIETSFQPKALPGLVDEDQLPATGPDMIPAGSDQPSVSLIRTTAASSTLEAANKWIGAIAEKRDSINEKKDRLASMRNRIEGLQKEMAAWMNALTSFQDVARKLESVINTLNLYLGSGEEIIQLANGKPADLSEPLHIRQLVLYMDEESMINAEGGGIDVRGIPEFDEWLLADPKNLDQVLPEPKGIICLKPRRSNVEYGEPTLNDMMNKANHETYILIRNGENLFRLLTGWQTGDHFFPVKSEFEKYEYDYFNEDENGNKTGFIGGRTRRKIKPEDGEQYTRMLKAVEHLEKHYSRALILLQGIVDRTGIFPEFQNIGLNLMDITTHNKYLRFVHDADPSKLMTTGRETFAEWQYRINAQLTPGDRIIGTFQGYRNDDFKERTSRPYEGRPDSFKLYTLERSGRDMRIMVEPGYEWQKNRIGFRIEPTDTNIIAFDQISLEDVEYFLEDRLSRSAYIDMVPLLCRVRILKETERNEEKPLIDLLVNKASEHLDLPANQLERQMIEVILWYKFKNKVHRSLLADDAKAFRMIMTEWKIRRRAELVGSDPDGIIDQVMTAETIFIGQRGNLIIRIERADQHCIFAHRTDFKLKNGQTKQADRKEWIRIGKEYLSWTSIFEHEEWADWPKGARVDDFLRPDELIEVIRIAKGKAEAMLPRNASWHMNRNKIEEIRGFTSTLYRIDLSKSGLIQLFYLCEGFDKKTKAYLYQEMGADYRWSRAKHGELKVEYVDHHGWSSGYQSGLNLQVTKSWHPAKDRKMIYWLDRDLLEAMPGKREQREQTRSIDRRYDDLASSLTRHIEKAINTFRQDQAKAAYLANYGDPRNWDAFSRKAGIKLLPHGFFASQTGQIAKALRSAKIGEKDIFIDKTLNEIAALIEIDPDIFKGLPEPIDPESFVPYPAPEPEPDEESIEDDQDDEVDHNHDLDGWEL